ncbi:MAG: hypothetical protein AB1847_16595 [bacterium]
MTTRTIWNGMNNFAQALKVKARYLKFFLTGLCLLLSCANQSVQAQQSSPELFREELNREISSLFRPQKQSVLRSGSLLLPSSSIRKCATPLLRQAMKHPELLNPENQFILHRPTDFGDKDYYGLTPLHYDTPEGHFRLYYTLDNNYGDAVEDSDADPETVPEYVSDFGGYFEYAYAYLTDTLHYSPAGGGKTEVFILGIEAYGVTSADGAGLYIMVKNNYSGFRENLDPEGWENGAMKVTAAHEFFHVVQAGYDHWPKSPVDSTWWEENTAVWIEDAVYPTVDDHRNYLGWPYTDENDNGQWDTGEPYFTLSSAQGFGSRNKGWFDYPGDSLMALYGKGSSCPGFEYGGVIWAKFLSERFGNDMIKSIFEQVLPSSYNVLMAIDQSVKEFTAGKTSFTQEFIHFKLANLRRDYEEGKNYPIPRHDDSLSNQLAPLSCQYVPFEKPSSGALRIHFDNEGPADLIALAIPAGSYRSLPESSPQFGTPQLIPPGTNHDGTYDFSFQENPDYSKLVIIPINLSSPINIPLDMQTSRYCLTAVPIGSLPSAPRITDYTSTISADRYLSVRLVFEPVRETGHYQIFRGREGEYQTMVFQSKEFSFPYRDSNDQDTPYQDSNSWEDSDHSLDENQPYLYQVKFISKNTEISSSEIIQVTTQPLPFHNFKAAYNTAAAPFSVEVSFEVDSSIAAYRIDRKIEGSESSSVIREETPVESSSVIAYTDHQVQENTKYIYIITVYDASDPPILFRRDISIAIPGTAKDSSGKNTFGCFIASLRP